MKFDLGETHKERVSRLEEWHPFFPLWPRHIGPHDWRVLEWVERRGTQWECKGHTVWSWEYRKRQNR